MKDKRGAVVAVLASVHPLGELDRRMRLRKPL
jgi:hypothetical protein